MSVYAHICDNKHLFAPFDKTADKPNPAMVPEHGLWIHTGKLPMDFDILNAIQDQREERIQKLAAADAENI